MSGSSTATVFDFTGSDDGGDQEPQPEIPEPLILNTADDFMDAVFARIDGLRALWAADQKMAFQLLTFLDMMKGSEIGADFLPMTLFLEAVSKKGADMYGQRRPPITTNSKLLYAFGYR